MASVRFKIKATDAGLEARGDVFRRGHMEAPVVTDVRCRGTRDDAREFGPGEYVWMFDLVAGAGPWKVSARPGHASGGPATRSGDTNTGGYVGHTLRFEVP